jgi:hypothetical protein
MPRFRQDDTDAGLDKTVLTPGTAAKASGTATRRMPQQTRQRADAGYNQTSYQPQSNQAYGQDPYYRPQVDPAYGQDPYRQYSATSRPQYQQRQAVPSPPQADPYLGERNERRSRKPSTGHGGRAVPALLSVLSVLCRVAAIALALLSVANAFVLGSLRIRLVAITAMVSTWLPPALSGAFVFETPFGGVMRGDFMVAAVVLFVVDWALAKAAHSLRR